MKRRRFGADTIRFEFLLSLFKYVLFAALGLCIIQGTLFSQDSRIRFDHLSKEHDLTAKWISSIFQDDIGYLWIGTTEGLLRYDGYRVRVFRNPGENPREIGKKNAITAVCQKTPGTLWIGTPGGLYQFDVRTGRFSTPNNLPKILATTFIGCLTEEAAGVVWIGGRKGLYKWVHKKTGEDRGSESDVFSEHLSDPVSAVLPLGEESVWLGIAGRPLTHLNSKTGTRTEFPEESADESGREIQLIRAIVSDPRGDLWLGTEGGGVSLVRTNLGTRYRWRPISTTWIGRGWSRRVLACRFTGRSSRKCTAPSTTAVLPPCSRGWRRISPAGPTTR